MDTEDLYRENEALQESNEAIETEIRQFNIGAFALGLIWGFFNGAHKQVCAPCILFITVLFIPIINIFCQPAIWILMHIYFGLKGNKWAWEEKEWKDIDTFKQTQKKWAIAGIITFIFTSIAFLVLSAIYVYEGLNPTKSPEDKSALSKSTIIIYSITHEDRYKNIQNSNAIASELVKGMNEQFKNKKEKIKCDLHNSNTIKISKYNAAAKKYVPTNLYTIYKDGTCHLNSQNCYVVSYNVENGRAVLVAKSYYDETGTIKIDKNLNTDK